MPDGSFPSEGVRSSSVARSLGHEDPHAYASRRRRASVGGFEEPRVKTGDVLRADKPVRTFGEDHRPDRGMIDRWEARSASIAWLGWMQDLSRWMKEARIKGEAGFTDQLWQNYAHRFPASKQLSVSGAEADRWDECLAEFFYASPVLRRVHEALSAKQRNRFSSDQATQTESLQRQLGDLKHHLQALDRASFRGYIPQAEQTIIDLERRLEQEHGIELEMRVRRDMARERGQTLSPQIQDQVVSEHRRKRLSQEYQATHIRKELKQAQDQLNRAAHAFRETLLAQGVAEKDLPEISTKVSRGDFSVLSSAGGVLSRLKENFRVGGLFKGLGSMLGVSKSVVKERAQAFYEASKAVDDWQTKKGETIARDRETLARASWLN